MAKISALNIDFSGGVTKNQMETIVNKINELVTAENKRMTQEINLNQEYNDATRKFNLQEALELSKNIIRAYGLRLRFLSSTGNYTEYTYLGTSLIDEDWTNENNWSTGIDVVDGGEF